MNGICLFTGLTPSTLYTVVTTGKANEVQLNGSKVPKPVAKEAPFTTAEAPDTIKPVITLAGTPVMNVAFGSTYTDPGATCTDNKDVTCTVVTTGTVNTSVP